VIITYMYWNNPLIKVSWPSQDDPIAQSLHNGRHCMFYDPAVHRNKIRSNQSLQDLCDWVNARVRSMGWQEFTQDQKNHYEIANLVKLNMWVDSLARIGNVKPMLLQYVGNPIYENGTGESRLRAIERLPNFPPCPAFISTHTQYATQFQHLESIKTFDRFAQICNAVQNQKFLFRLTDDQAPYGLYWYEYDSSHTASVTPGIDQCVAVMNNYMTQHPATVFTPEWFDTLVLWEDYKSSN